MRVAQKANVKNKIGFCGDALAERKAAHKNGHAFGFANIKLVLKYFAKLGRFQARCINAHIRRGRNRRHQAFFMLDRIHQRPVMAKRMRTSGFGKAALQHGRVGIDKDH